MQLIKKEKYEVSRRKLLQSMSAAGLGVSALPGTVSAAQSSTRRKVVRIWLPGGISHLDSFDPKPERPELMGDTQVIRSNTGETLSAYFPNLAKCMDKLTLIRSMWSSEADHTRAQYLNKTSYPMLGTTVHPDFGAWMQKLLGNQNEDLPSSVAIRTQASGGYMGTDYDAFGVGNVGDPLKGLIMKDPKSEESLELLKLMANVRKNFHENNRMEKIESYRAFYNDSIKFMHSSDLEAFDLKKESPAMLKKYNVPYGMNCLLARRLLQANVQYVSLSLGGWDSHFDLWNETNFPTQARELDKVLAIFIDDLHSQGLFKDTILAVNSDFGRSPGITAEKGRNHHRSAFASIIAGSGVKKGIVYGKSDEQGMKVVENAVSPADFNATLATLVGINLDKEVYSPDNRPFTVARGGKPAEGILA